MSVELGLLHSVELEIVKEFHRICEENHLRYVLAFGSMIGAVRHKGFIPWDDDVDIVMPWEDYCEFNRIANNASTPDFMVQNTNTVERHVYPFSRFVKKRTCAIIEYPYKYYHNQAIYIDVFPALFIPASKLKFRHIQISNFFYSQVARMESPSPYKNTKRGFFARSVMFAFYCLNKVIPKKFCYSRMMKRALSVNERKAKGYYIGDLYSETNAISQFQMPLDVFNKRVLMKFEDTELYMPKEYDTILRNMYGDYMDLPPEDKRKSHNFLYVSDKMSYQDYDLLQKQKENL